MPPVRRPRGHRIAEEPGRVDVVMRAYHVPRVRVGCSGLPLFPSVKFYVAPDGPEWSCV